jgi:hypothetical protein
VDAKDIWMKSREAIDYRRQQKDEMWRELDAFDRGEQWTTKGVMPSWIPRPSSNLINKVKRYKTGALMLEDYLGELKPLAPEDEAPIWMLQRFYEQLWEKLNIKYQILDVTRTSRLLGTGILYLGWDENYLGGTRGHLFQGEILIKEIEPSTFFIDPAAFELEEALYCGTFVRTTVEQLLADPSIENNSIRVVIEKRFRPLLNQAKSYRVDFYVPLKKGTSLDRLYSEPSFGYVDEFNIERTAFIEEVPQSFTGLDSIEVLATGDQYTEIPSITIEGDGTGATAVATIVNGKLKSVIVTNSGSGYSAAVARVVGGEGAGAQLRCVLQGKKGSLRVFYYDANNIKRVINSNAGTIYYDDGYLVLDSFNPTYVSDPFGTLVFKANPNTNVFSTTRNAILTLDTTDPAAIDIRVSAVTQ